MSSIEKDSPKPTRKAARSTLKATAETPQAVQAVFQPNRLGRLALLVGLAAMLPYLLQNLPNLSSRSEYRIRSSRIQIVPEPTAPVPKSLLDQIIARSDLPGQVSTLDKKLPSTLTEAFERHPWIAHVRSIRKEYPPAIIVEVEYRQPVATIQVRGERVPIDASGVILPSDDFKTVDLDQYPTLQGPGHILALKPGQVCRDPSLVPLIRLAEVLAPDWADMDLQLMTSTQSSIPGHEPVPPCLELRSNGGSKILWGRSPGSDHPGELTSEQKLGRLKDYLAEFTNFDRPSGPYEIDIRHWEETTRRPLKSIPEGRVTSKPQSTQTRVE